MALSNMNQIVCAVQLLSRIYVLIFSYVPFQDEISDAPQSGLTTVKFDTSKPMSSYLACFIVCDFAHIESDKINNAFSIRVFARRKQISNVHHAMKIALSATKFYLSFFNVEYPLPKLGNEEEGKKKVVIGNAPPHENIHSTFILQI